MQKTFRLFSKRGSEGPDWDPYSYVEYIAQLPGLTIKAHLGLGSYLKIESRRFITAPSTLYKYESNDDNGDDVEDLFKKLTGVSIEKIEESELPPTKCPKCASEDLEWVNGMPGEEILICNICKHPCHCDVNLAEVI